MTTLEKLEKRIKKTKAVLKCSQCNKVQLTEKQWVEMSCDFWNNEVKKRFPINRDVICPKCTRG